VQPGGGDDVDAGGPADRSEALWVPTDCTGQSINHGIHAGGGARAELGYGGVVVIEQRMREAIFRDRRIEHNMFMGIRDTEVLRRDIPVDGTDKCHSIHLLETQHRTGVT
jgi:hypothetical protein